MQSSTDIRRLIEIMAALRTPGTGCPWDLRQDHASLAAYALEEAYEVVDAIERGDLRDLREELGDLLLQVVYHARIAEEAGAFAFGDVVEGVTAKMIRRHPHVFAVEKKGSPSGVDRIWEAIRAKREARSAGPQASGPFQASPAAMAGAQERGPAPSDGSWEAIKAEERRARDGDRLAGGLLDGVARALPGLARAVRLQAKAATVGFDWNDAGLVLAKIREEIAEVTEAVEAGAPAAIADEIGDLLFAVANLARHVAVDPEQAVRGANAKFARRFAFVETRLATRPQDAPAATLADMDALWDEAKAAGL